MDRIERDVLIEAPAERVWAALTEFRWVHEGERPQGDRFVAHSEEHGDFPIVVEQSEPHQKLVYRWASAFPGQEPGENNSTRVEFTLTEEGAGTRLSVVETGFAALPGEAAERAFRENSAGWGEQLGVLRKRVENPAA